MNDIFSVILLHFNQPQYVKRALDSVFDQDYPNIQLIFADDHSSLLNQKDLLAYCEANKKQNIQEIIWQINETNLGTVKNLNRAVSKATGKYILFFAADDALASESVLSEFTQAFAQAEPDVYMISGQCLMMDESLNKLETKFVSPQFGAKFNTFTAQQQYGCFAKSCALAIGATAMRANMFEDFGMFDERYQFVEDYSYYLKLTRSGGRILYRDFDVLLHRAGGISHTDGEKLPAHVVAYRFDIVNIVEKEVFPYLSMLSDEDQQTVLKNYKMHRMSYELAEGENPTASEWKLFRIFGRNYFRVYMLPNLTNKNQVREEIQHLFYYLSMIAFWGIAAHYTNGIAHWLLAVFSFGIMPAVVLISGVRIAARVGMMAILKTYLWVKQMRRHHKLR